MANTLRDVLEVQDWTKAFLSGGESSSSSNLNGIQSPIIDNSDGSGRDPFTFTPISRKAGAKDDGNDLVYDTDDAENKYRRRGMMQLLVALGIVYVIL